MGWPSDLAQGELVGKQVRVVPVLLTEALIRVFYSTRSGTELAASYFAQAAPLCHAVSLSHSAPRSALALRAPAWYVGVTGLRPKLQSCCWGLSGREHKKKKMCTIPGLRSNPHACI